MELERPLIQPDTSAAYNVIAGWLNAECCDIPEMPKQRNQTRANYRKTHRKRSHAVAKRRPVASAQMQRLN